MSPFYLIVIQLQQLLQLLLLSFRAFHNTTVLQEKNIGFAGKKALKTIFAISNNYGVSKYNSLLNYSFPTFEYPKSTGINSTYTSVTCILNLFSSVDPPHHIYISSPTFSLPLLHSLIHN